jgi:hypothetical protein
VLLLLLLLLPTARFKRLHATSLHLPRLLKVKKLLVGSTEPTEVESVASVAGYVGLLEEEGHFAESTTISGAEMKKILVRNAELNHNLAKKMQAIMAKTWVTKYKKIKN